MTQRMDEDVRNFVLSHRSQTEQKTDVSLAQVEKYYRAGLTGLAEKMNKQRGVRATLAFETPWRTSIHRPLEWEPIEAHLKSFIRPNAPSCRIILKKETASHEGKALYIVKIRDYIGDIPDDMVDVILENKDRYGDLYVAKPSSYSVLLHDPLLLATVESIDFEDKRPGCCGRKTFYVLGVWGDDWFDLNLDCFKVDDADEKIEVQSSNTEQRKEVK